MLESMRQIALDALWVELDGGKSPDPEAWYQDLRRNNMGTLFPKLVEPVKEEDRKGKRRYYTLRADAAEADLAVLEAHEFKEGDATKLPFINRPPIAPAVGPVIKRTTKGSDGVGPLPGTIRRTLQSCAKIADSAVPEALYFQKAFDCFSRRKLSYNGGLSDAPEGALSKAVASIDEKGTVLLAYLNEKQQLPGEVAEYVGYLSQFLAEEKYVTKDGSPVAGQ